MTERLEVLNLAGNRLTDGCSSYLFTILQKCKGMCESQYPVSSALYVYGAAETIGLMCLSATAALCLQLVTALFSLDVEQCSITSRTVQKMADALHEGSVLSHLSIGTLLPLLYITSHRHV